MQQSSSIKRGKRNKMSKIYPILLAGGTGTRLWPLSRKSYPKQFTKIVDELTLFQKSAQRLLSTDTVEFSSHITLTNADYRFIVSEQLQEIEIDPGPILIEPEAKNTAAAILAACLFVQSKDEDAILLVAPSDHLIPDTQEFHAAVRLGLRYVETGKMVTFGIEPKYPETGYGYLELSSQSVDCHGVSDLKSFVEKPNIDEAANMLASGNYLWNAGIFLFRAADMIDAFRTHSQKTFDLVSKSVVNANTDLGFIRLANEPWAELDDISIDYAIMEKVKNLVAVPYNQQWSDLGDWESVWRESSSDDEGNVLSETAHLIDCRNSLLRAENEKQQLVGFGLDDIMAISMPDAVLVAHKSKAQDVKKAVKLLKEKSVPQAETLPKDHRPWGWFESLVISDRFQVKRIFVKPGGSLSLQSHHHRSEHWIVVEGTAKVTIDEEVKLVTEGQSVYVPLGAVHRMENPGKLPMVLIEVQIGTYLGEDDIIRYEDVYSRN